MDSRALFEILIRDHADMLLVYLRSVARDSTLVDDLFQETMITAWRTLDRFDRSRAFGPWLRGIAGKLLLAHRRTAAHQMRLCNEHVLDVIESQLAQLTRQPGDSLDEKLELLRTCIAALPEGQRDPIHLRYHHDLPYSTIAERLHLEVETVKKRLQRARSLLLDCVQRKLAAREISS